MAVARQRRSGAGRLVLVALLLTAVVLIGNAVASSTDGGPDPAVTFLDQVRPLATESVRQGADLADLRATGVELGREGLRARMDRLVAGTAATARAVEGIRPPEESRRLHGLLLTALLTRADAVSRFDAALAAAFGEGADAAGSLTVIGDDLIVADRAYALFVRSLPEDTAPPMPASQWVDDAARWSEGEVRAFVDALRAGAVLAPVHDLRIVTLSTEPAAVGTSGDLAVLPVTRNLKLQVVVANVGNEVERRVAVEAVLTAPTGAVDAARQLVELVPGQQVTVQLGGLQTTPGGVSTLLVRVGPPAGEATPPDNEQVRLYLVR